MAHHDHHHHVHHHDADPDDGEPASTGFLPLSLAIGLFICGLFAFGLIPKFISCGDAGSPAASP